MDSNGNAVLTAFWDDPHTCRGRRHYMDYSLCGTVGHRSVTLTRKWAATMHLMICCTASQERSARISQVVYI